MVHIMRTTLTIDPDNAAQLERLRKERNTGLKETLNEVLRNGFVHIASPTKKREPFRIPVLDCGKPNFNSPEELKDLLDEIQMEDDLRKLGMK
jgi:hypothetical protein